METFFLELMKVLNEIVKLAVGLFGLFLTLRKVLKVLKGKRKTASSTSRSSSPNERES